MEYKLTKHDSDYYTLHNTEGVFICDVNGGSVANRLSLKNCQSIERGYDLMDLAEEDSNKYYDLSTVSWHCNYNGFFSGFQKALEILGDKKFSENDLAIAFIKGVFTRGEIHRQKEEYLQSLQQTQWDVIVEMEPYHDGDFINDGKTHIIEAKLRPRLDPGGCLILKRK